MTVLKHPEVCVQDVSDSRRGQKSRLNTTALPSCLYERVIQHRTQHNTFDVSVREEIERCDQHTLRLELTWTGDARLGLETYTTNFKHILSPISGQTLKTPWVSDIRLET